MKVMVNHSLIQFKQRILIFILILYAFMSFAPAALAAPTGDISQEVVPVDENMYFVEISADVPDDFDGTVYVLLSHESGEYYTVSCNKLSGFSGIRTVPKGEYFVEQAYTSEDSFLYDTILKTDSFVLADKTQVLNVTVKENELGQQFLENPDAFGPDESTINTAPEPPVPEEQPAQEPITPSEPSGNDSAPDTQDSAQAEPEAEEKAPEEIQEPENPVLGLIKHIMIFLSGSAVFCGIVFVIVYYVRKRNS